jgi:hypothetical protein
MKAKPEYLEGPEAFARFDGAMKKALSVSHDELKRRIEAERRKAALNPRKRGPKPQGKDLNIRSQACSSRWSRQWQEQRENT